MDHIKTNCNNEIKIKKGNPVNYQKFAEMECADEIKAEKEYHKAYTNYQKPQETSDFKGIIQSEILTSNKSGKTGNKNDNIEAIANSKNNEIIDYTKMFISRKKLPSRSNENKVPIGKNRLHSLKKICDTINVLEVVQGVRSKGSELDKSYGGILSG
ncbi:hypothetical protein F8M41_025188 [Gigaspora margarita]|uniref:Uncharacterized protein n=1 Tax=Gigaspora margarita TaxID=4874 RepID=A0A8H4B0A7_GIGMA|nr:hypothetical protein F8M41_025188 [Gigaspora margarita]